ncbi:hypothetical protein PC114_g23592, partial [Phytophthora cactorum]
GGGDASPFDGNVAIVLPCYYTVPRILHTS